MPAVQDNVQQNNIQNDKIDILHKSNQSMYNDKSEIVMDNDHDEKECDDIRKEGETTSVSELDDTDIGQV